MEYQKVETVEVEDWCETELTHFEEFQLIGSFWETVEFMTCVDFYSAQVGKIKTFKHEIVEPREDFHMVIRLEAAVGVLGRHSYLTGKLGIEQLVVPGDDLNAAYWQLTKMQIDPFKIIANPGASPISINSQHLLKRGDDSRYSQPNTFWEESVAEQLGSFSRDRLWQQDRILMEAGLGILAVQAERQGFAK